MDAPPIFVGGTGRSGTTIVGRLLGEHSAYCVLLNEAKFHAATPGLPGLLRGLCSPEDVARYIWRDLRPQLPFIDGASLDACLERFMKAAPADPVGASRNLTSEVFEYRTRQAGTQGWVEMTPANALHAREVATMFPEAKSVHVARDGRDVVASLIGRGWMTDYVEALGWWELRVGEAHRVAMQLPAGSSHLVQFEQLFGPDRDEAFQSLLAFLGWDPDQAVQAFFETEMSPEMAHIGRWRDDFDARTSQHLDELYVESVARLVAKGVPVAPAV